MHTKNYLRLQIIIINDSTYSGLKLCCAVLPDRRTGTTRVTMLIFGHTMLATEHAHCVGVMSACV